MKMVKKILLGTLAVAAILSIASCKREEGGNSSIITVNAGSSSASIDKTNDDANAVTRGFKTLQTKHTDAICKLSAKVTGDTCDGVMGYIFDYLKNEDETLNFTIAGLRLIKKSSNWQAEAYVETYRNVDGSTLETGAGFKKTDGTSALVSGNGWESSYTADGFGKQIIPCTGITQSEFNNLIETAKANDTPVDIWVELVANLGADTNGRSGTAGTYTVNFYSLDPHRAKDGNALKYGENGDKTADNVGCRIATVNISAANVNTAFTAAALPQTEQGFYATVYGGQTLKGEWKFDAIKQEAEEIEE